MRKKIRGRPTRDEAAQLTEHLISVASTLFQDDGFSAVSMNRIAATANVGKEALYARFANKEALFFAVIERQVREHRSTCPTLDHTTASLEEILRQYGHWLVRASSSAGAVSRTLLFYREAQRFEKLGQIFEQSYAEMFLQPLEVMFAAQQKQGRYVSFDTLQLASLFCDAIMTPRTNRLIARRALPDAEEDARHVDAVVQLFTRSS